MNNTTIKEAAHEYIKHTNVADTIIDFTAGAQWAIEQFKAQGAGVLMNDLFNLKLSEFVEQCLKKGVVPVFEFKDKNESKSTTNKEYSEEDLIDFHNFVFRHEKKFLKMGEYIEQFKHALSLIKK